MPLSKREIARIRHYPAGPHATSRLSGNSDEYFLVSVEDLDSGDKVAGARVNTFEAAEKRLRFLLREEKT